MKVVGQTCDLPSSDVWVHVPIPSYSHRGGPQRGPSRWIPGYQKKKIEATCEIKTTEFTLTTKAPTIAPIMRL